MKVNSDKNKCKALQLFYNSKTQKPAERLVFLYLLGREAFLPGLLCRPPISSTSHKRQQSAG